MAIEELRRSNIQALWRHLPDQTFNWRSIASVVGKEPRQVSALDVHEDWVAPLLRRHVVPFAEATSGIPGSGPEVEAIDQRLYELVKAEDLQAERFPNTFVCPMCGRFEKVHPGALAPTCAEHGRMRQTFVEVHNCGHLAELKPPRCASQGCSGGKMRLRNTSKFQVRRWYWQCGRCHLRSRVPVTRQCSTCGAGRVHVLQVPQNSVYYPQQITVLNPPTKGTYAALSHEHVHAAAVAQAIGELPVGADQLAMAGQTSEDTVAMFLQFAATFGWKKGDDMYERGLADAKAKAGGAPAWHDAVAALGLDDARLEVLGEECRQLSLVLDAGKLTVEDLIETSSGNPLEPQYHGYRDAFAPYGISDITLLRELPVAYIVAGYTRGADRAVTFSPRGDRVTTRFRFFPPQRSGKFPMYGIRTETEGLLVQLDPLRVVYWLVASGVVEDPEVATAEEARRWLFTVTDPASDPFNAPTNKIAEAVLALTHSVSHRLMKSLAARCGLSVDSLAEFLFPTNMAFLIYANTRSEFILGGLEHVFRYDLGDALEDLAAETRCVFDPPCRDAGGGACAACLYVFEAACCRFNTVLDRNRLFGSVPPPGGSASAPQEVEWQPFWRA